MLWSFSFFNFRPDRTLELYSTYHTFVGGKLPKTPRKAMDFSFGGGGGGGGGKTEKHYSGTLYKESHTAWSYSTSSMILEKVVVLIIILAIKRLKPTR